MKVGDYVRTKKGEIGKIIGYVDEPTDYFFNCYMTTLKTNFTDTYITEDSYDIKSSSKIIDLIEVGDLVYVDISPDDCGGIIVPRITETENELNLLKLLIENKDYILKSIITHEQIESMEYKVKE